MRGKDDHSKDSAQKTVRDIRRATRRQYSAALTRMALVFYAYPRALQGTHRCQVDIREKSKSMSTW